jgi:hypothetical protein
LVLSNKVFLVPGKQLTLCLSIFHRYNKTRLIFHSFFIQTELADLVIPTPDHSPYSVVRVIPVDDTIEFNIGCTFKEIIGFGIPITLSLRSAEVVIYKYRWDLSSSFANVCSGPKQQRSTNIEKKENDKQFKN